MISFEQSQKSKPQQTSFGKEQRQWGALWIRTTALFRLRWTRKFMLTKPVWLHTSIAFLARWKGISATAVRGGNQQVCWLQEAPKQIRRDSHRRSVVSGKLRWRGACCSVHYKQRAGWTPRNLSDRFAFWSVSFIRCAFENQRENRAEIHHYNRRMGCSDSRWIRQCEGTGRLHQLSSRHVQRNGADEVYSAGLSDRHSSYQERKNAVGAE